MATKPTNSLSQQLSSARIMAEGIKKRADVVSKVGLTEQSADEIKALADALDALNTEQEELKARLKTKTAEMGEKQKALQKKMSDTRKLVKVAADKNDWLTFGISATQ